MFAITQVRHVEHSEVHAAEAATTSRPRRENHFIISPGRWSTLK
jgi:hypothetical protein